MIETPWGGIEVADAHVHFFSPEFFRALAQQKGVGDVGPLLGWETPESAASLADRWTLEMDRQGVGSSVLVASTAGEIESVVIAAERHPARFHPVVMMNPTMAGADTRISRALERGAVRGIFLFPAMHKFSLQDHHVFSLLSIVAGYPGAVVYVHFGMLSVGFRDKLGLSSPFDMRFSNPVDLHAVALAFPHLHFVIPHFGAGYLREALMVAELCPNVYFDTSSSNNWMRCEPTPLDLPKVFAKTLEVLGPRRLLFGTDSSWFPRGWVRSVFDEQVQALRTVGIDGAAARAIFGGNLRALFRRQE